MPGLGASRAGLCGDVLTWLRSEAHSCVCSSTVCVMGLGCLAGGTWENLSGEWAGLASALGAHLCWACGTKGLRRQQKGGKSCFSRVNLFNTLSSDVGHGLLRDSKPSEKKNCPLGSPQWFCCRNVISFDSILSSHLGKLGAENHHQRRGITSATTNVPF